MATKKPVAAKKRRNGPRAGKKKPRRPGTKVQTAAERRARFAAEYLIDGNATQAAIRAGYSVKSARAQGSVLLTHRDVRAAIDAGRAKLAESCRTSAEWARAKLRQFAEANMLDFASWDGGSVTLKDSSELTPELGACVQEITQTADGVRIKLVDRRAAIADLRALDGLDAPKRAETIQIIPEWLELLTDDELDMVESGKLGAAGIAAIASQRKAQAV